MPRSIARAFTVVGIAAILAGSLAGLALANIPDTTTKVYTACMSSSGSIRLINYQDGKRCTSKEKTRTWNQRGPAGAPGVDGTEGPAGVSGYEVVAADASMTIDQEFGTASADCPEGKVAIGGGYKYANPNPDRGYGSFASDYPTAMGWEVVWYHGNQTILIPFTVYAVCATAS